MQQRGNILFLILLAVVLFAALSYAVTSSMRGAGKDAGAETTQTGAAAITQYVSLIRNEVQRLMLVNDCKVANLDWRHDFYKRKSGAYSYSTGVVAPVSPKAGCAVFTAYGGSITPQSFEKYADPKYLQWFALGTTSTTSYIGGHGDIRWGNRKNEGTSENDIALVLVGINPKICSYLLDPQSSPPAPVDTYTTAISANFASPAAYTTSSEVIDDPINLAGDFFAYASPIGVDISCSMGAVILPQ